MKIAAKILEALGIASIVLSLRDGLMGQEWNQLYFFLLGIAIFLPGWGIEKYLRRKEEKAKPSVVEDS